MKTLNLIVLSVAALACRRPAAFCTANAEAEAPAEHHSPLALLAKGAGVDIDDVRWRVQAGLDPEQAVQAALSQKHENERAAAETKKKKPAKEGGFALPGVMLFLAGLVLAALAMPFTGSAITSGVLATVSLFGLCRERLATANTETAPGTHKMRNLRADAAHSYTHLLIKTGSDAFHGAVCGASDYPIGSTTDSPEAAEDIFHVNPLNNSEHTRRLRCATAIAADTDLYAAANGFVSAIPGTAGTYYHVGRSVALAVQEGSSNYVVEAVVHAPRKTLVIAAATGTAATDIAALYTALQSGPDEIKAL